MPAPDITALAASTLYAARPVSSLVAEIDRQPFGAVTVRFPARHEGVMSVCRDLGFSWKDAAWRLVSDFADDRAAEAAHRLLAIGIHVRVSDEKIRAAALSGGFKAKPTRWVAVFTKSEKYLGWFAVCWSRSEDWYAESRRLPGARYEKPFVAVPREAWREVQDFAVRHAFELMPSAADLADQMKAVEDAAIHVQVQAMPARKVPAPGRPVLTAADADTTIPAELRDDT